MKRALVCLVLTVEFSSGCKKEKPVAIAPARQIACTPLKAESLPVAGEPVPKAAVYWDVSGSVSKTFDPVVSYLVSSMDSRMLQLAGAAAPYRHYPVGTDLGTDKDEKGQKDASIALTRNQMKSALHDAFMHAGAELAQRSVGLSIIVTDLEIDAPSVPKGTESICYDVPVPSDGAAAAPIIGRCLASGWKSKAQTARGTRPIDDLVIRIFRSRAAQFKAPDKTRHLYVIAIATDLAFEERFAKQFRAKTAPVDDRAEYGPNGAPGFDEWIIVNTQQRPTVSLTWRPSVDGQVRISDGQGSRCAFSCFEQQAKLGIFADVVTVNPGFFRVSSTATARPSLGTAQASDSSVGWTIPCIAPRDKPEELTLNLSFGWEKRFDLNRARANLKLDHPDVEDVLQSMVDGLYPLLAPRTTRVTVSRR